MYKHCSSKTDLIHLHKWSTPWSTHYYCSTSITKTKKSGKRITNYRATEILKSLHHRQQSAYFDINQHNQKIVTKGIEIYNKIDEQKNEFAVNSLIKLCLKFKHPNQVFSIWNDIKSINGISLPLIIECCIKSINIETNKSIEILQDIAQMVNNNDIITKTALIHAYSHCTNHYKNATNIFDSIPDNLKDSISICALKLYEQYHTLNDNISHLLALKACINCNDFAKGIELYGCVIILVCVIIEQHSDRINHSVELHAKYFNTETEANIIVNNIRI